MMDTTDKQQSYEEMIQRFQNGEEKALKTLIRSFHPIMKKTIYHQIREQDPVDDIAQNCWYIIIKKLSELELKVSFKAWALSIARRKAIDWIRKQQQCAKHAQTLKSETESEQKQAATDYSDEKLKKVQEGIQQLPATQQIVLELFYLDNLSLKEISNLLEISKGTVKSRLFYAREKLKQIIS
ncbi:RNA polymerase sigma factor [Fodinibius halophilus]|uniref:RNA polymerase sigma factor n=1 Tax=Fodinibius halophilus TaxID=1736908 RepID=A0A6M1TBU8_9BACT|nr:RNA polymerase sigma factor [Fodinibius halophilus]NGP89461.1 RNA polymerase sigma factor [Fodinibius halophilus]